MTTEEIRKVIIVRNWVLTHKGLSISYERTDAMPFIKSTLFLSPEATIRALYVLACIDEFIFDNDEWVIEINGASFTWDSFVINYKTCQWESLQIAINHEAEKELANDMNMLELDAAIDALK
jgi:hypothetical protein